MTEQDVVLAVPRALLYLPNRALEMVFLPVRGAATAVDRYSLIERTKDLLYFNQERTAGVFPTGTYQTGYGFSFGAQVFHNDLLGNEEHLSARAAYGGIYQQGYQALFEGDHVGGIPLWLEARVRYEKKPAILFYGIGDPPAGSAAQSGLDPREASVETRFRQERLLALLSIGPTLGSRGNLTQVGLTTSYNRRSYGPEEKSFEEPSIETVYDTGSLTGFRDGIDLVEVDASVNHDGTDHADFPSRGAFVELLGGRAQQPDSTGYWHGGAELAVFIDLFRGNRVLVLRGALEAVGGDYVDIPFTELPRLGGPQRLRGYVLDRFRDRVATVGTVEYRYPIHEFVSGALFVDTGSVGASLPEVFGTGGVDRLRLGAGGGLTLHSKDREDVLFRLEIGYGDELTVLFTTDPLRAFSKRSRQL